MLHSSFSRSCSTFVNIAACMLGIAVLFFGCELPPDPAQNPDNVVVSTSLCRDGDCYGDTLDGVVDETLSLELACELPHLIDSVSVAILPESSNPSVVLYRGERPPEDTTLFVKYDYPCTLQVVTGAVLCDGRRVVDTATLFIREVPGSNSAPVQELRTVRTYATPALPCSVFVKTTDAEKWQTLRTTLVALPESAHIVGDSLFIWTPGMSDTGSIDTLIFICRDNSSEAMADTDTVIIAVILDDAPPASPQGFEIVQRHLKNVTFCWNRVLSADYYRIFRNDSPGTQGWALIDSTADTAYTDETDTAFYYQIVAVNLFYKSKPSVFISGKDTLFHGLFFPDSAAEVAETDSVVTVAVRLTEALPETLTVSYAVAAGLTTVDTSDFLFVDSVHSLQFAPGDTVKNIRVRMIDDTVPEQGETIALRLVHTSTNIPVLDSVYKCLMLPDRDSLKQQYLVSMLRIVCEMADDEGTDNTIDVSVLDVWFSVVERTADSTAQRVILSNTSIHPYNGGEIGMATSSSFEPWASKPAAVVLDADRFDPSKAIITFGGYALDVDPVGDDAGGGGLTLAGKDFAGPHSFTIVSNTNFVIRAELMVETVE